ncbi:hypothetical protein DSL64_06035 [Dyadobacter luteus]|uniref:Lipocalin-like domain-containing protein n=1 Tax=Dyadobacter luteus TaxID=2259619 RepID=A0A3D8YEZ6_9BACT|nr:lipocalin family protein [Dyadobacter luteus]REA63173.1 hypothetical protein DSL64_06035 [Dyadobacter luteus]
MKTICTLLLSAMALASCQQKTNSTDTSDNQLIGTWKLVSSKVITKGDTSETFPVPNREMIKMFTDKEFAFFNHNIRATSKDSTVFSAGSGTYELKGEEYTEHLTYCNYREWENHDFHFKLKLKNDTLIQTGVEKIDSLGIDQEIIEIYVKK